MPEILSVLLNVLFLVLGMVLLIKGADFFVDGSSRVAKALKIPALIIGLTLVSIGTSLPELSVSVNSALQNASDMSFGNVVGSNIFNVLVVIGASALFTPMIVSKSIKKFDIPIVIGFYLLLTLFAFLFGTGSILGNNALLRWESLIFVILIFVYLSYIILSSKEKIKNTKKEEKEDTFEQISLFDFIDDD